MYAISVPTLLDEKLVKIADRGGMLVHSKDRTTIGIGQVTLKVTLRSSIPSRD